MKHLRTNEFDFHPGHMATTWRPGYPLSLRKPQGVLRIGHLSDFHFGKPTADGVDAEDAVWRWIEDFGEVGVDLLFVTGDLVEEPDDEERLPAAKAMLDKAPFPYVVIPGNHDVSNPGTPGTFEKIFGQYPRLERHGDLEIVLLDSMQGLPPSERSLYDRMEAATGKAYSRGKVGQAQLDDLEGRFAHEEPLTYGRVMLVHHHLRPNAPTRQGYQHHPTEPWGLMGPLEDAHDLIDWASQHRVRVIFHGHKHNFWDPYEPRPGVIVLNSGTSTRAKADRPRRARIVDLFAAEDSIAVHDLELSI
ncbi:metallophosphoesterase family protein [Persicimonas caeni]|nr:metallophosphoesterase [Persicimonas caeni]